MKWFPRASRSHSDRLRLLSAFSCDPRFQSSEVRTFWKHADEAPSSFQKRNAEQGASSGRGSSLTFGSSSKCALEEKSDAAHMPSWFSGSRETGMPRGGLASGDVTLWKRVVHRPAQEDCTPRGRLRWRARGAQRTLASSTLHAEDR
jgi:hypothetical protein